MNILKDQSGLNFLNRANSKDLVKQCTVVMDRGKCLGGQSDKKLLPCVDLAHNFIPFSRIAMFEENIPFSRISRGEFNIFSAVTLFKDRFL